MGKPRIYGMHSGYVPNAKDVYNEKYIYSMPYNAVQCKKCKVFGKTVVDSYEQKDGKAEAIEAWNRRTDDGKAD